MLLKDQERGASHSWEAPFTADLTTATILIVVSERNGFFTMVAIDQIDTPQNPYKSLDKPGVAQKHAGIHRRCPRQHHLILFATILVGD